ncbi:MAG: DUF3849 domain-containing protein [Clostridia bacterium]|nr:DUF3849 domain-containing protein [Clostridia bacterium]MBQ9210156.1 DUF3849 domain-containing protein [Clostridia bacterium]
MTLFETVKSNVTTLQAAERYGLKVGHGGMCRCPFHNDKHPSMKVDQRFHCFGCQADGDVIDFTSRLFQLTAKEAALKLADDFGMQRDQLHTDIPVRKQHAESEREVFLHKVSYCYQELASYRNLLVQWRQQYAPQTPDEEPHPRFMEAIRNLDRVEYELDLLQSSEEQGKMEIVNDFLWDEQKLREAISMEAMVQTPVYHQSAAYAREHGELEQYRQSHHANIDCKRDIEKTVSAHFDGMRLDRKAAAEVLERFGAERVALVLAATVQAKSWDGRFSAANKDWAFSFDFPDAVNEMGFDRRHDYAVETHPAVLDGFINWVRQEIRAMEHPIEKEASEVKDALNPAKPAKKKAYDMER